ncbi:MAG: glucokinase [Gallionella sp.]|nr:glucokinase [Gallionella sp.]
MAAFEHPESSSQTVTSPGCQRVLSGDIGGTKTRLAVMRVSGNSVEIEREATYVSRAHATFDELLAAFIADGDVPESCGLGIAGPVIGRTVRTTNLPWYIDADALQQRFGFRHCILLNDLEAIAAGLPALQAEQVAVLQVGDQAATGNAAVIAAGTGLGEAGLFWDGARHHPYATEGGHASFSPQNEIEFALLSYLQTRYGHVSWERVVSGMGLLDLHEFMRLHHRTPAPVWLDEAMRAGDAAAAIANAAMTGKDELCVKTLAMFVRLYGAEAGNLALKSMSRGGLYIAGGIAPKLLPLLQQGEFLAAFLDKGRMRHLLEAMPVRVILSDHVALYGPALRAAAIGALPTTMNAHHMPSNSGF